MSWCEMAVASFMYSMRYMGYVLYRCPLGFLI